MSSMGGGWGLFGIIWMLVPLLFLGGLVALIVWAVTQHTSERHATGSAGVHEQSAEEILRQRFAHGEIDAEEYEERRHILNESTAEKSSSECYQEAKRRELPALG
jgi:putative membrane protein